MTSITTYWNSCNVATASSRRLPITLGTVSAVQNSPEASPPNWARPAHPKAGPEQTPGSPAPHRWSQTQHQAEPTQPQAKLTSFFHIKTLNARHVDNNIDWRALVVAPKRKRPGKQEPKDKAKHAEQRRSRRPSASTVQARSGHRPQQAPDQTWIRTLPLCCDRMDARSKSKRRHPGITERRR